MDDWYYIHLGRTYGPVSGDELRELAEAGILEHSDPIWRKDTGRSDAVPAGSVLVFFLSGEEPRRPPAETPTAAPVMAFPPSSPPPEWLSDLIDVREDAAPEAPVPAPDWLQDVRNAEQLPAPPEAKQRPRQGD